MYEIADDDEGLAYLKYGSLRDNFLAVTTACNEQLAAGTEPRKLLGIDVPRFAASVKYFEKLATKGDDAELAAVCARAVELLDECSSSKRQK